MGVFLLDWTRVREGIRCGIRKRTGLSLLLLDAECEGMKYLTLSKWECRVIPKIAGRFQGSQLHQHYWSLSSLPDQRQTATGLEGRL